MHHGHQFLMDIHSSLSSLKLKNSTLIASNKRRNAFVSILLSEWRCFFFYEISKSSVFKQSLGLILRLSFIFRNLANLVFQSGNFIVNFYIFELTRNQRYLCCLQWIWRFISTKKWNSSMNIFVQLFLTFFAVD